MKSKAIYLNIQILNLTLEFVEALRQDNSQNHEYAELPRTPKEHQGSRQHRDLPALLGHRGSTLAEPHRATAARSGHQAFAWHR